MNAARCHCGAVILSFAAYDASEQGRCDCSICRRKGGPGVTVRAADLVVEKGGTLSLYTFGTHTAKHYFCSVCGIHTHHRRSSNPAEFRVNAGCIDGFDLRSIDPNWRADDRPDRNDLNWRTDDRLATNDPDWRADDRPDTPSEGARTR